MSNKNAEEKKSKKKNEKNPKIKHFAKKKSHKEPENVFIQKLKAKYDEIDIKSVKTFNELPLSPKTLKGLKECGYTKPTDIQKATLALSLKGKDILGAAQTGSGKTLAFLIPILEHLFCKQWTSLDGLGAIVITPTRELAYQIFETLRRIGEHHDFSAGLIIGGKDLKFERNRMDQCNIMICTPGRLLQHMDENPLFDAVNMQILVLDEADRCLDMGFEPTMNAIIANLPLERQTMLFSATQTKSVKDLARLSLKEPAYVAVHENSKHSTPEGLQQTYTICELKDKVSILWSFIKSHLKQKIIIFFSSCKEVKYFFEVFSKLRPGTSLMPLYGTLHQLKRMEIYESFCKKQSAVLFSTDLAARGLDFPEVHWVVQADCPEDSATYIHRVGRTARYHRGGESLLLLLPSEKAMLDELAERKIPIEHTEINPTRLNNPVRKMEAYLASNPTLKDTAQRAFVSYAKSVFLMKNKKIFDVQSLDTDSFAHSLGLAIPPRIRFLQRLKAGKTAKPAANISKPVPAANKIYFDEGSDHESTKPTETIEKEEVNNEEEDSGVSETEEYIPENKTAFQIPDDSESDNEAGMLKVKRKDHDIELPTVEMDLELNFRNKNKKHITKAAIVKKILKKNIVANKKIVFNEEGEAVLHGLKEKKSELAQAYENEEDEGGINIEKAKLMLKEEDKFDKQLFKEKVKAKHREEKKKLKALKMKERGGEQEEKDDFGDDESDDDLPDLSWVPDPSKVYGDTGESEFINTFDDEQEETEKTCIFKSKDKEDKKSKKRKKNSATEETPEPKKIKKKNKIKDVSSKLSVMEAEELAMMLLKK